MPGGRESQKIKHRYNRIAGIYDSIDSPMEHMFAGHRKDMLKEAHGKVLEVGAGTGKNFEHYPDDAEVTAIDFSPKMVKIAKKKAAGLSNIVQVLEMDVESMSFDDNTFDAVVTSCVFCSVPHPVTGLKEIRRVCKSGAKSIRMLKYSCCFSQIKLLILLRVNL